MGVERARSLETAPAGPRTPTLPDAVGSPQLPAAVRTGRVLLLPPALNCRRRPVHSSHLSSATRGQSTVLPPVTDCEGDGPYGRHSQLGCVVVWWFTTGRWRVSVVGDHCRTRAEITAVLLIARFHVGRSQDQHSHCIRLTHRLLSALEVGNRPADPLVSSLRVNHSLSGCVNGPTESEPAIGKFATVIVE